MDKNDKQIYVVSREILFPTEEGDFQGFISNSSVNYETRILERMKLMRRGDAEEDTTHKQPIGYMLVVNRAEKKVFAYQRSSKDKHYGEKRLQGNWSWGVGGHVEHFDAQEGANSLRESRLRELREEIEISGQVLDIKILGYINDDSNSVGKVHFGLLYSVEINGNAVLKDKEMAFGKMMSLSELEEICSSPGCIVESWSRIALEPLRTFLQ